MDLAELGILFYAQGYDATLAKMLEMKAATIDAAQSEEDRTKSVAKLAASQNSLSEQITRSIIAYDGAKSSQYEFSNILLGSNDKILKQIDLLKQLEDREKLAKDISKEWADEHRKEQGYLQDLARDIEHLNKVRAQEAADSAKAAAQELAARQKYYDDIVAKAKAAEQAITDARHKAIIDAQDATAAAAALYIKEENDRVKAAEKAATQIATANKRAADTAATQAEQQAMAEIAWAQKSRDEQIRIKGEVAAYRAAGISDNTIANKLGSASLTGAIKETETLAEKFENVRLNTSRVRTEAVVLAHEMVQGRFSRIPATLMVFAEYSDISALAMSGLGLAVMGAVAAGVLLSYWMVKGILEQKAMADALIMTGNYAGTTAAGLNDMAHAAAGAHGSIGVAKEVMTQLAASGKMTASEISIVGTAIVGIEHATGMGEKGVANLVKQFESLQVQANAHSRYSDEISKATVKLDGEYHFLSTAVLANIQALEAEGHQKEASTLATKAFADALKDRSAEMQANLGNIEKAWQNITYNIGRAKDAIMGWGKDNAQTRLQAEQDTLGKLASLPNADKDGSRTNKMYAEQLLVVAQAQAAVNLENDRAVQKGERARLQTEGNLALSRMEAEVLRNKADKLGEFERKKAEVEADLAKIKASPTSTDAIKLKAEEDAALRIEALRKKSETKVAKPHLTDYDKITNDIKKFTQATDDMTESGKKQTAAERFQSEAMQKADDLLKLGLITQNTYNDLQNKITEAASKRKGVDADQESARATAALVERNNKALEKKLALQEKEAALLQGSKDAAADYINMMERQAASKFGGLGKGDEYRKDIAGEDAIENKFQKKKEELAKEAARHDLGWYGQHLDVARDVYEQELEIYKRTRAKMKAADADWKVGAGDALANYNTSISNVAKSTESAFTKAFKGMEDALVSFVKTGKIDMASLADSIMSDIIRIQIQKSVMPAMSSTMSSGAGWLASLFNANGNAFASSGVQGFANGGAFHNSVLTSTTPFMFASGGGFAQAIAGEAGPEAVMPLTRGANGKLGVQSTGGGGNSMVVNIIESPGNGGKQARRTENGVDVLDIMVEKVKSSIAGDISRGTGSVPNAMSQTYGLNRVAGAY